MLARKKYILWR